MHRLVEVAYLPHLIANPGLLHAFLERSKLRRGEIILLQTFEDRFRRQDSGFDREMNSFQAHRIQESTGVPDQEPAFEPWLGHREPSAFGNRFAAVRNHTLSVQ